MFWYPVISTIIFLWSPHWCLVNYQHLKPSTSLQLVVDLSYPTWMVESLLCWVQSSLFTGQIIKCLKWPVQLQYSLVIQSIKKKNAPLKFRTVTPSSSAKHQDPSRRWNVATECNACKSLVHQSPVDDMPENASGWWITYCQKLNIYTCTYGE